MPQSATNWTPTPKQAAVLEAAQEAGMGRSISTICETAGVDRSQFYRWMRKDPQFAAAWRTIWHDAIGHHLPGIVAAQVSKALDGDTPAARLLADLAGVLTTRMDVKAQHTGKMEVETQRDNTEDLRKIIERMSPDAQSELVDALWSVEDETNATTAGDVR